MLSHSTSILCILIFVLVILSKDGTLAAKSSFTRKVTLFYNPGCNITECNTTTTNSTVNLIYARAQGANDSLHYVLSTVGPSPPTLLLLRSDDNRAILRVNWTQFLLSSLENVTGSIKLVSEDEPGAEVKANIENVMIFDRLLEYNDSTGDANIVSASSRFSPVLLSGLTWDVNITDSMQSMLKGTTSKYPTSFSVNSSVSLNFSPFGSEGQQDILPSLPHNANSSDWEMTLDSLLSRGNGSRFSVEMLLLSTKSNISKSKIKSIDDEYSPSIFTTEKMEWSSRGDKETSYVEVETFSQWRAVSYTTVEHQRKYSTDVKTSAFKEINKTSSQYREGVLRNRLLRAYFSSDRLDTNLVQSVMVSFGEPDDGFYATTKYLSWTSTIGFGSAPVDVFSMLIICMLFAGVGCPLMVIIAGGVYLACLKIKRSRGFAFKNHLVTNYGYQPIS